MNAKTCKRLRRAAELASVGMPARKLLAIGQRTNKTVTVKGVTRHAVAQGAVNDPRSLRGVYRHMKRRLAVPA